MDKVRLKRKNSTCSLNCQDKKVKYVYEEWLHSDNIASPNIYNEKKHGLITRSISSKMPQPVNRNGNRRGYRQNPTTFDGSLFKMISI